jgi:hypothetical protein
MNLAIEGERVLCERDGFLYAQSTKGLVPVEVIAKTVNKSISTVMSRAICKLPIQVWFDGERCAWHEERMRLYVKSNDVPVVIRALA